MALAGLGYALVLPGSVADSVDSAVAADSCRSLRSASSGAVAGWGCGLGQLDSEGFLVSVVDSGIEGTLVSVVGCAAEGMFAPVVGSAAEDFLESVVGSADIRFRHLAIHVDL